MNKPEDIERFIKDALPILRQQKPGPWPNPTFYGLDTWGIDFAARKCAALMDGHHYNRPYPESQQL